MDCGYTGSDIVTRYNVPSLLQCGRACFNFKDCNYFTFASQTCSLKKVTDITKAVVTQGSICGMFPNRITKSETSSSGCKWQTSADGSAQWAENCWITGASIGINAASIPSSNITTCVEACKANPQCNYFFLYNGECGFQYMPVTALSERKESHPSGFIVARRYNVEFIPNYCDPQINIAI